MIFLHHADDFQPATTNARCLPLEHDSVPSAICRYVFEFSRLSNKIYLLEAYPYIEQRFLETMSHQIFSSYPLRSKTPFVLPLSLSELHEFGSIRQELLLQHFHVNQLRL